MTTMWAPWEPAPEPVRVCILGPKTCPLSTIIGHVARHDNVNHRACWPAAAMGDCQSWAATRGDGRISGQADETCAIPPSGSRIETARTPASHRGW